MHKYFLILLDRGLGDNIHFSKTLDTIAEKFPDHKILLIGTKNALQVFENRPFIHATHAINYKQNIVSTAHSLKKAVHFIKQYNVDAFYTPALIHRSTFTAFLCAILNPFCLGVGIYNKLLVYFAHLHQTIDQTPVTHSFYYERDRSYHNYFYHLTQSFPSKFSGQVFTNPHICRPKLHVTNSGIFIKPTIGIHAGTSKAGLHYCVELYADVAFFLAQKKDYDLALFSGNADEDKFNQKIIQRLIILGFDESRVRILPQMHFQDLCNSVASLQLLICNDSGPMHIASATNTPIVAYPAPLKNAIRLQWQPYNDTSIIFTAQDVSLSKNAFMRLLYKTFKPTIKPKDIKRVIHNLLEKLSALQI